MSDSTPPRPWARWPWTFRRIGKSTPPWPRTRGKSFTGVPFPGRRRRGRVVRLILPGTFYYSSPLLNGRRLGRHEGYFEPQTHDVTIDLARRNELVVEIDCPDEKDKTGKRMLTGVFSHWDCLDPTTNPGGLWLAPYLAETGWAYVTEARVHTKRIEDGTAFLLERIRVTATRDGRAKVVTTLSPDTFDGERQTYTREVALHAGDNYFERTLRVDEPRLWWTHDLGAPDLYRHTLRVEGRTRCGARRGGSSHRRADRGVPRLASPSQRGSAFTLKATTCRRRTPASRARTRKQSNGPSISRAAPT
ncbi:MAG: hypothetical protein M5R36_18510 [Deltaproteobacteria bacterium]|nr:hypothetical protein [Deltaproteobacteria bacterium]